MGRKLLLYHHVPTQHNEIERFSVDYLYQQASRDMDLDLTQDEEPYDKLKAIYTALEPYDKKAIEVHLRSQQTNLRGCFCSQEFFRAYKRADEVTYTHMHACIHAYMHTYIHTYIHI